MNIEEILKERKCMSCGGCSYICPKGSIHMEYNTDDGLFRPVINDETCIDCSRCKLICPAAENDRASIKNNQDLIGPYVSLLLAHAANSAVRHNATSGGVINALICYLLESKTIEAAVLAGYDPDSPIETRPFVITLKNVDLLKEKTRDFASRYVCVPILSKMKEVRSMSTVAIVGTPCQMIALDRILSYGGGTKPTVYRLGITCSGGMSYKATEEYKRIQKLPQAKMYYRGDGWPGKNSLISSDDKIEYKHNGSLFERMFSSQIFKNSGCRNCHDHFAEKADISFCDFWDPDERKNETEGNSCVIIRSEKAAKIFEKSLSSGCIEVQRTLTIEEVEKTQMHVLKAKKGNLHSSTCYKLFIKCVDFIYKHRLYRRFGYRIYNWICLFYRRLCDQVEF